ncbi:alkaline phosphatase family protein [Leucobacter sp. GX24907]
MLPIASDNGARLAAILPTGIAALARGLGTDAEQVLAAVLPGAAPRIPDALPGVRSLVVVVVDGLGHANLRARAGHARALSALPQRRIETVIPSTTAAALTTITTGRLPGEHGLVGYRIRHPKAGLISPLKEWEGVDDPGAWQRATPLFGTAAAFGVRTYALGRPAHATGGLTEAILAGAEYLGGQRIADRFAQASGVLRGAQPTLCYLYIDELDKAGHEHGWEGDRWLQRLEQFDAALDDFLRGLPGDVGVVVTADHGMVDVLGHQHVLLDADDDLFRGVQEVGGEPRMRSLYLRDPDEAEELAARWSQREGKRAWVGTREEAVANGWFGPTSPEVAERIGHIIIAARKRVAYYCSTDDPRSREMIGQHGSLGEDERGVPLILGGALIGTGFAAAVSAIASERVSSEASAEQRRAG